MQTKLDDICDTISEIEFDDDTARTLVKMMDEYRETYSRTYYDLMRRPGFKKLWSAISESARYSCRHEDAAIQ